jgi:hypothetical protein
MRGRRKPSHAVASSWLSRPSAIASAPARPSGSEDVSDTRGTLADGRASTDKNLNT